MSGSNLQITIADKNTWKKTVDAINKATVFHTWEWLSILEKYAPKKFGKRPKLIPLILQYDDHSTIAAIPIFIYELPKRTIVYSPPPKTHTLYLGPLINWRSEMKKIKITLSMLEYISENLDPAYVRIVSPPRSTDYRPYQWRNYRINMFSTYFIELHGMETWANLPKKLRKNIASAEKKYEICTGGKKELQEIIARLKEKKHLNGPEEMIHDVTREMECKLIVAKKDGELISGTLFLKYNNVITAWIGNAAPKTRAPYVNELVMWKGMEWGIENDCQVFEILGAHEEALFPFKAKFNPEFTPYINAEFCTIPARFIKILKKLKMLNF
ncbi:Acetyltransferase {GNAT} domain [Geoglobus ahangari]|uniref:Acetyltransferase (GNAT) domain n=1 Tax=Geoglobus ahangari TaxID=113653 RepID=A0A0F7DC90_9EURY|nr:GNAT family N-acetyltransferase [Geoglobus ahangari]AKG92426.1 Acetyltransferase {GNAT} domain [Geoglobus ahangari]